MVMIFIPCPQPVDEIHTLPSSMVRLTINFIMPQVKASQLGSTHTPGRVGEAYQWLVYTQS